MVNTYMLMIENVLLQFANGFQMKLNDVLFVPGIQLNLLSVRSVKFNKKYSLNFWNSGVHIRASSEHGQIVASAHQHDKLYVVPAIAQVQLSQHIALLASEKCSLELWHQRLGHVNIQDLKSMITKRLVTGPPIAI